jgi:hypothetical protein
MPGLLLFSFGYFVQKRQDLFRTDPVEPAIPSNVVNEFGKRDGI